MKNTILALFIILPFFLFSQNNKISYGNGWLTSLTPVDEGNFLLLGFDSLGIHIRKIDEEANIISQNSFLNTGSEIVEFAHRLLPLSDSTSLIVGELTNSEILNRDSSVIWKVTNTGELIWRNSYERRAVYHDAIESEDGFIAVGRDFYSGLISKISLEGDVLWHKEIRVSNYNTRFRKIYPTDDGNYIIIARTNVTGAGYRGISLLKITPNGDEIWSNSIATGTSEYDYYGDEFFQELIGVYSQLDGSFIIANPWKRESDVGLFHFDADGQLLSVKEYGSYSYGEIPSCISLLANGDWLVAGRSITPYPDYSNQAFIMRIKQTGQEVWRRYFEGEDDNFRLTDSKELSDGRLLFCGVEGIDPKTVLFQTDANGRAEAFSITGRILVDSNGNCLADEEESPIQNQFVENEIGDLEISDSSGVFTFYTDNNETTLNLLTTLIDENWEVCQNQVAVNTNADNPDAEVTFLVKPIDTGCSNIELSITQPSLVRCTENKFWIYVNNNSHSLVENQILTVQLAQELEFLDADAVFEQVGQTLTFDLGNIDAFSQIRIEISTILDCNTQLGTTHPIFAEVNTSDCLATWTGAEFDVTVSCEEEDVKFYLQNIGSGEPDTTTYSVYADHVQVLDSVEIILAPEEFPTVLDFPADGRTWRLEINQVQDFPRSDKLSVVSEGCGVGRNGLYSIGYEGAYGETKVADKRAEVFPMDLITTTENTIRPTSYGYGRYNLTENVDELEFTIKVQNPFPELVNELTFDINLNENFDITTAEIISSDKFVIDFFDDDLRVNFIDISLDSSDIFAFNLKIESKEGINPDTGPTSLFLVRGKAYFDCRGPILLSTGFTNYSANFPLPLAEVTHYTLEVNEYGGRQSDLGSCMAINNAGDIFLGGESSSFSDGIIVNGMLVKTDEDGVAHWLTACNYDNGETTIKGIIPLENGGCIVTGNSKMPDVSSNVLSAHHPFIAEYDGDGQMVSFERFRPGGEQYGAWVYGVVKDPTGGGVIHGYTQSNMGIDDFFVKISEEGEEEWINFEASEALFRPGTGTATAAGDFVFVGSDESVLIGSELSWKKINTQGETVFLEQLILGTDHGVSGIIEHSDDGFLLVGNVFSANFPTVTKITETGETEWSNLLYASGYERVQITDISRDLSENGGYLLTGISKENIESEDDDILLLKINEDAVPIWIKDLGKEGFEIGTNVISGIDFAYILGYNAQLIAPDYNIDFLLIKTGLFGSSLTDVEDVKNRTDYASLVFPNPASNQLNVFLSPTPTNEIFWKMYDINGKEVKKGKTESELFDIQTSDLPKGMYLLHFLDRRYKSNRVVLQN